MIENIKRDLASVFMTEHVALVRTRLTFERDRELQSESAIETTPRASIDQTIRCGNKVQLDLPVRNCVEPHDTADVIHLCATTTAEKLFPQTVAALP